MTDLAKNMDSTTRSPMLKRVEQSAIVVAAIVGLLMGSAVMLGWILDNRSLISIRPTLPPMQFNTAFGFLFSGAGYLAMVLNWRLISRCAGALVLALGVLTLSQYLTGYSLGIDDIFIDQSPDPNRMAPNTAFAFSFVGATILIAGISRRQHFCDAVRVFLTSMTLVLGLAAFTGYTANLETAYGWGDLTRMALHTSSGFIVLGVCGLIAALSAYQQNKVGDSVKWLPGSAAVTIWIYVFLVWKSLQDAHFKLELSPSGGSTYSAVSWVILLGGFLLGVFFYISLSRFTIAHTEIKSRAQAEIQLSDAVRELKLQQFAVDQHSIVAITDTQGIITNVNDKFCEISGYTRQELLGRTHRVINSGTHTKEFFIDLWKTIINGDTWKGEICNRAKDASLYWVDTTIVPFSDTNGNLTQFVSIRTDITAHKDAESKILTINQELRERNAEMEQFTYTVSHDLKSPLVTIRGYVDFLRRDVEAQRFERVAGFIESIMTATDRMRVTIDDLLELSRVGRMTHTMTKVSLDEVISVVVSEIRYQFNDIDAELDFDTTDAEVWGDQARLEQVLQNLLANALKYAHVSDRKLRVHISTQSEGDTVRLLVDDNGPGIDPIYAERIFGLFERLESDSEGTGIGLAIVKRIAEIHGGKAWVESNKNGGARFIISLESSSVEHNNHQRTLTGASI
ncbi:MAG: ATP-binding protein [Phycisphaerales bacterium]